MLHSLQKRVQKLEKVISLPYERTDDDWRNMIAFGPESVDAKIFKQFNALPDDRRKAILSKPSSIYKTLRTMEWLTVGDFARLNQLFEGLVVTDQAVADKLEEQYRAIWYCRDDAVMDRFKAVTAMIDGRQWTDARDEIDRVYAEHRDKLYYPVRALAGFPETFLRGPNRDQ
jgi:hypothetical protein